MQELLIVFNESQNFDDLFEFNNCWVLSNVILLIIVDVLGFNEFSFLAPSYHPVIDVS